MRMKLSSSMAAAETIEKFAAVFFTILSASLLLVGLLSKSEDPFKFSGETVAGGFGLVLLIFYFIFLPSRKRNREK